MEINAYELESDDWVCCYSCQKEGDFSFYRKGEAFLADASHYPWNAEANYFCLKHLQDETVISITENNTYKEVTAKQLKEEKGINS